MRLETGKRGAGASGDITGQLTARLQLRASNYDIELEYVLRRWMAMQLPEHAEILLDAVPPLPGGSLGNVPWASFFTILGDGIILCDLANKVSALANLPELRVKIERNVGAKRLGRFRNVSSYISWSAKFGLPLFTMDALVEGRDPSAVQLNLHRLYLWEVKRAKKVGHGVATWSSRL